MLFETDNAMMAQARRAVREGRPDDAQGILVNIVVTEPYNDEAWILLAETMTDPERKMECLEHARRANPRNPAIQRAIADLKAGLAATAFAAETRSSPAAETAALPSAPPAPTARPELAVPLLERAETVARNLLLSTEPANTRNLGLEIVFLLDRARGYDETTTRRWAHSAGRDALVKYERTLTTYITNLPAADPQLALLREQRQRALDLLK